MILCVGTTPAVQRSMVFAHFQVDEVNRAKCVRQSGAGKAINVSRVLTLLGRTALGTGFIGGETGRFVLDELDLQGVPHRFVSVPFATRTCTTILDESTGHTTELVEESQPVDARKWNELEGLIHEVLPTCKAMILSGGLPPESDPGFYARCCAMAREAGVPAIIDARGEPLRLAMKYEPLMVKPNRAELASTFGFAVDSDEHFRDAIRRLIGLGTKTALITMGAKGAILSDGKSFWHVESPKVPTVNPIGSGDSVAAGYAAGVVDGLSVQDCAVLGIACGAANAMTDVPGVLDPREVERLRKLVVVRPF